MEGPSRVLVKNLVHIYEKKTHKQPEPSSPSEHGSRIQLKFNEVVSSMGRTEDVVSILHREGKISDEEKSDIDRQLQSIPLRAKEDLLVLLKAKPRDAYDAFLDALNATGQQRVVQILVSEIEISDKETSAHAGLIVRQYNWLTDNINADGSLVVALYRNDVLTKREREQLDSEPNRPRRTQLLLAILGKKTDDKFQRFLSGLEETNQVKVVNKLKGIDAADGGGGDVSSCPGRHEEGLRCASPAAAAAIVRPDNNGQLLHTRTVPKPLSLAQKPSPLTAKPSILSPKPQRSTSLVVSHRRKAGEPVPSSPTGILSPTRRTLPTIERQLSNPTSPVFHEISLKVASLRQSCTDVEDEIKRKKHQECAQLNRDQQQQGDGKKEIAKLTSKNVDQNSERTRNASRSSPATVLSGEDIKTGPPAAAITTATAAAATSRPSKHDDLLSDQLRSSLKENEELRTRVNSFSSRQKSLEAELQKLRTDHEVKLKDSSSLSEKLRLQLEEKAARLKEMETFKHDLDQTRIELTKEIEVSRGREKHLIESKARLDELQARNEDLESRLNRVQSENQNARAKSEESSEEVRGEYEKLLRESTDRIHSLEMQLQRKESEYDKILSSLQTQLEDAKRQNRDKILNLEKQLENDELEANRKISELENKLQDSERNLNRLIAEETQRHSATPDSEIGTSQLQALLTSAREKISDLTEQLHERTTAEANKADADSEELSRLKSQLDRERELGRERESLLVESLEKNADLLRQMGLTSERLRDKEQERSKVLEEVRAELADERKLRQKQQKDLADLQEAFDRVDARLREAESHSQDEDKTRHELDRLLSQLNSEKRHRQSLELALQDQCDKTSTLQSEINVKEKLLSEKTQETEVLEDLMSQLNEEKLLRIEVDKRLYDADEEIAALKQRSLDHEKLLHKANKEKELLNQRLAELDNDTHTKATLKKLITEANEQTDFLQKRCEQQQILLQRAEEERQTFALRFQEMKNEAALRLDSEQRLRETEQELHRLRQHSDNQKTLLQQAHEERNALAARLTQLGNENRTRNAELTERLEKADEEISFLRRQNDDQKKVLERQSRDSEEHGSIVARFQQEHDTNAELRKKLKDAECKLSALVAQLEENRHQMEEFKEQELEITQLLQDVNNEKRLRYEQQQKLDDAKGTIAILNQRLETAENESKLRLETEYSNTAADETSNEKNRLAAATQRLQELAKELKERDSELWRIKKELAKERLLKKDAEKASSSSSPLSAAAVGERREADSNRGGGVRGHRITGDDADVASAAARNAYYPRTAAEDSTDGASQDPGGVDALPCVVSSGPPLNVRLNVDRPKRKKNHVVRSRAGLLAQREEEEEAFPVANGSCDDEDGGGGDPSQTPRRRLRPRNGGHEGRTRPDSMGGETIV